MSIKVDIAGTGGGAGSLTQPHPRDGTPPDLPNPATRSPVSPNPASVRPPTWTLETPNPVTTSPQSPTPSDGALSGWHGEHKRLALVIGSPWGSTAGHAVVGFISHDNQLHIEVHQMTWSGITIPEERWYTTVGHNDTPRMVNYGPAVPINLNDVELAPQWRGLVIPGHRSFGNLEPSYKWNVLTKRVIHALDNGNPYCYRTIMVHDPPRDMELTSL